MNELVKLFYQFFRIRIVCGCVQASNEGATMISSYWWASKMNIILLKIKHTACGRAHPCLCCKSLSPVLGVQGWTTAKPTLIPNHFFTEHCEHTCKDKVTWPLLCLWVFDYLSYQSNVYSLEKKVTKLRTFSFLHTSCNVNSRKSVNTGFDYYKF